MSLIKHSLNVGVLTFVSRMFGYIRDAFVAFALGAGPINDAFIIALRLPNLFRSLFAEGAFTSSFVPLYSAMADKSKTNANKFSNLVRTWLVLLLVVFTIFMMTFMSEVVAIIAPGYIDNEQIFDLMVTLSRISFPYIVFMSFVAFYGGMLNSYGKYYAFAASPIIMNLVIISSVLFMDMGETPAHALSFGVVASGIFQLLWMIYFAKKTNLLNFKFVYPAATPELKLMFKRLLPAMMGSGTAQINVFVTSILASYVVGGISYIYYADRIYQLPLAIIGTAVGTVLLPILAREYQAKNPQQAIKTKNDAIEFCALFTIPAAIGLIVLAEDIVCLLFERGEFSNMATVETAKALTVFAFGLPSFVLYKIISSSFFAAGDTKTPVKIAMLSLLINILISISLLSTFKHVAIAIGAVTASWISFFILLKITLDNKRYQFNEKTNLKVLKFIASGLMMMVLEFFTLGIPVYISIPLEIGIGAAAYLYFCYMFKAISKQDITNIFRKIA